MKLSRRDLAVLFPALAAAETPKMQSTAYRYEDLPVKVNGQNKSRAIFNGETQRGLGIEMHETELPAGGAPHASHHHVHEELIVVREGTMEVNISGKATTLSPGSVVFVVSNEEHGVHNSGTNRARYYIISLGREKA
jgi:quercetin dioxygenase-like cupin family protein